MFEHILDNENWKSLRTNVGTAEHIPFAVLELMSKDKNVVENAYWKIDNYAVLQGELSESAKYLPKYLEEVLVKSKFKEITLELLFQIGSGFSLNKNLESECYNGVILALQNAKSHSSILGRVWVNTIKSHLTDLKELRNQNT